MATLKAVVLKQNLRIDDIWNDNISIKYMQSLPTMVVWRLNDYALWYMVSSVGTKNIKIKK